MKKVFFLSIIALSAGVVAFVLTLTKYDSYIEEPVEIVPIRIENVKEYLEVESSIRINPTVLETETKKVASNLKKSEIVKEVSTKPKNEVTFIKPCDGKIVEEFSAGDLIYSKTLKEWIIHNGIDITGSVGEEINSICDGEIIAIKYEHKQGDVIEIKNGEYVVKYACIEPLKSLKIGDKVERGEQIATISEDMGFELDNGSHLHLEILKNNVQINPSTLILNL